MEQNNIQEIDIRKVVRQVLEHWWWFAIGVAFFVMLGIAYYVRKSPQWTTDATIMLRQKDGMDQLDAMSMLGLSGNQAADDEVVVLNSRGLMHQAIDALNLWDAVSVRDGLRWKGEFRNPALSLECLNLTEDAQTSTFIVTVKRTKSGYKVKTKMGLLHRSTIRVETLSEPIETAVGTIRVQANRSLSTDSTYRLVHSRKESVVAGYMKMLSVSLHKKDSKIIKLSMRSPMPERDKALIGQIIEQYNLNAIVDKNMIATNTASFIDDRLAIISKELSEAEDAVTDYKTANRIADLGTQAQLFLEASSKEERALVEIETQLTLVDYVDGFLRDETKRNSLIPANIGISDASIIGSISEYNAILLQRMRIQRTATNDNPVIDQMDQQLSSIRQNIIATIASVRESMLIRQRSIRTQDNKYNKQIKEAPEKQQEYARAIRAQQIRERLYLYLYQKREENALLLASTATPAKIVDVPQRDVRSKTPKLFKLLFICFVLGLLFPAGLLYIYLLFNDKVDDAKDYERRIKAPLLGQIITNSRNAHIAIHEGESTVSAELFRLIRTNLRYVLPQDVKTPVILVTSCINGEGKSYISSNTALSLAILGKKVALVGLDIRKPMLADYFGLKNRGQLTYYLTDSDVQIEDIIVPSGEHKNLDIIPCGMIPPNPSELLQTQRLDDLFAELRKRYDYVIVDTAPVALVSDTYLLDRISDMTIFVSRYKYTPSEMIEYINTIVDNGRLKHIACVLNGVSGSLAGYGYGYGYGAKQE
ncbi:MAG: polysaccharide biosynthesis tyrosine autokinase [Paludibacteraceae bacterium]|nr:polysaccharide biosynthesis tyrosine autokinase [Paludibacteraceae bacterium]